MKEFDYDIGTTTIKYDLKINRDNEKICVCGYSCSGYKEFKWVDYCRIFDMHLDSMRVDDGLRTIVCSKCLEEIKKKEK